MIRFLARMSLILLANAAGIIIATVVLPGFTINAIGFITSVVLFTTAPSVSSFFKIATLAEVAPPTENQESNITEFFLMLVKLVVGGVFPPKSSLLKNVVEDVTFNS